jgi:hypothetical protein
LRLHASVSGRCLWAGAVVFEIMDGVCVSAFGDKGPWPCLCWCVTRVLLRVCRAGAVMVVVDCFR